MKKIIFFLTLLSIGSVRADTITPGPVGLILIGTGTVDRTRRWDDKYNGNYSIIASSFNTLFSAKSGVAVDTTAINNRFSNVATDTTSVNNRFSNVATDTTTINTTIINRFSNVAADTTTVNNRFINVAADTTTINNRFTNVATDTTTIKSAFYNHNSTNDAILINISASTTTNANRAAVIVVNDEGTRQGDATTINFVGTNVSAVQSGSTATVTVTGSSGGGGLKIPFEMTVGTVGAIGVDAYVGSLEQFNLVLASFGATGLTFSTTGQGRILFTNGLYNITGATVPAGIKIVCQSTVNFILGGIAQTMMTNYGTVGDPSGSPCYIDAGGQAFANQAYVAKGYSVNNLTFIGGQNQANLTGLTNPVRYCSYCVIASSLTRGNLWFKEFRTPSMDTASEMGTLATIAFQSGINSNYFIKSSTYVPGAVGANNFGRTFFSLSGSTYTDIVFDAESASTGFLSMTKNNIISRFSGYAGVRSEGGSPYAGDSCVFCINNYAESIGPSSGTVFENMIVQVYGGGDLQIFRAGANGATFKHPWNVNWTNVRINCNDFSIANTYTGIVIGSDSRNAALTNVMVNGCGTGINNGGTNTKGTAYINGTQTTY